ncbi:5-formyltetrahydrofolate cyclo-ligase [Acetobacteraceae bacterium H6797]|nr:5-formyltetrahydrofolate cyclo-ligase [Acetobacteraceae bacterium H6797]
MTDSPDLIQAKTLARRAALAARNAEDPIAGGQALAALVLTQAPPPPGAVVAGFWPMGQEIDIRPLLQALAERGHRLALPFTPKRGLPLVFRQWEWGAPLEKGQMGTSHPGPDCAPIMPDWVLVPLLAFDRRGYRLGYGGGFYDRTLATLPHAEAIGVAFASQEVPAVPVGPHDWPLRRIATNEAIIETGA